MNKIYKLVWSKTRKMYVAVCEFARSHTKSAKSGIIGKTLTARVMLSLLAFSFVGPVWAADKDTVTSVVDNTTKLFLLGHTSAGTAQAKYDNNIYTTTTAGQLHVGSLQSAGDISGTTGTFTNLNLNTQSIVLGSNATNGLHAGNNVVIGNKASSTGSFGNVVAIGDGASVIENGGIRIGGITDAKLGTVGIAGRNAISMGFDTIASGIDSIALGNVANANIIGAIALGSGARAETLNSVAIGLNAFALQAEDGGANRNMAIGNDAVAYGGIAIGRASKVGTYENRGNCSAAIGDEVQVYGDQSVALGSHNVITDTADYSLGIGYGGVVESSYSIGIGTNVRVASGLENIIAIGKDTDVRAKDSIAIGPFATILAGNSIDNIAIGKYAFVPENISSCFLYSSA